MNQYGGGNYNPYSTTSYGSNGPTGGGGFYNQTAGGGGGSSIAFEDGGGAAGGGFGSPGSASKVCPRQLRTSLIKSAYGRQYSSSSHHQTSSRGPASPSRCRISNRWC